MKRQAVISEPVYTPMGRQEDVFTSRSIAGVVATLLREMDRRHARHGIETICVCGGQGPAAMFGRA